MTYDEIADRLEVFIRTHYSINADDLGFTRDVDLFDLGYVDSIGLVELLGFIKTSFEVDVNDDDLLSDKCSYIHGMSQIFCHQATFQVVDLAQRI